jgi:hypothetical protein
MPLKLPQWQDVSLNSSPILVKSNLCSCSQHCLGDLCVFHSWWQWTSVSKLWASLLSTPGSGSRCPLEGWLAGAEYWQRLQPGWHRVQHVIESALASRVSTTHRAFQTSGKHFGQSSCSSLFFLPSSTCSVMVVKWYPLAWKEVLPTSQ